MKRIQSACLLQTIHFILKEDIDRALAVEEVRAECEAYKASLERKHIPHCVESEETLDDGSIIVRVRRQYNSYDTGDYLK